MTDWKGIHTVMRNTVVALAAAAAAGFLAAGCSSTPASQATAPHTPAAVAATQTPRAAVLSARQVASGLRQHLPVTSITILTAATDPNHLLGRPGEYTSKARFRDSRIPAAPDVTGGGEIEVFATSAQAVRRARYIQQVVQAAPILGAEYDYVAGPVLLRVSGKLTPSQAAGYALALAAVTGSHVREIQ